MKYIKKPIVVEAVQWNNEFGSGEVYMLKEFFGSAKNWWYADIDCVPVLKIQTLDGIKIAEIGDYIVKGLNGDFYLYKPDIFERAYEQCDDNPN